MVVATRPSLLERILATRQESVTKEHIMELFRLVGPHLRVVTVGTEDRGAMAIFHEPIWSMGKRVTSVILVGADKGVRTDSLQAQVLEQAWAMGADQILITSHLPYAVVEKLAKRHGATIDSVNVRFDRPKGETDAT